MAISRNAFQSLIESVQEAICLNELSPMERPGVPIANKPKPKTARPSLDVPSGRPKKSSDSVSDIMQGIANGTIKWGDASIGGAMNATELSLWLAGQMGSGKPSVGITPTLDAGGEIIGGSRPNSGTTTGGGKTKRPSSGKPGLSTSVGAESGVVGSRGRNPMTSTSTGGPRKTQFDMAIRPPAVLPTSSGTSSTSSGKSSKSSKPKTKSRVAFGSAGAASSRSGGAASRASATRTVADSVDLSDLVDALSMIVEANRPYIPSNLSGSALTQYLNNLSQGGQDVGAETGASGYRANSAASRLTSTRRRGNKRPTITGGGGTTINTGGGISGMGGGVSSVGLGEDFDILDEILAEGLELYGEDGLAEILADFAETGEMSQELADLLEGSDQLQEVSLKKK